MVRDPVNIHETKIWQPSDCSTALFLPGCCLAALSLPSAWLLSTTHCCLSVLRLLFNCLSAHFLSPLDSLGCIFAAPAAPPLSPLPLPPPLPPAIPISPTTVCTTSCTQRTTGTLSCLTRFEMKRCSSTVKPSRRRFNLGTPIAPFRTTLPFLSRTIYASTTESQATLNDFTHATCPIDVTDGQCSTAAWSPKDHPTARRPRNERTGEVPYVLFEATQDRPWSQRETSTCYNLASITLFEGAQLGLCRGQGLHSSLTTPESGGSCPTTCESKTRWTSFPLESLALAVANTLVALVTLLPRKFQLPSPRFSRDFGTTQG